MRFETRIGIAIVILGAMTMVIGSAGFTSTQADRSVTVNIVGDGDAYVGLGPTDEQGQYDGDVEAEITSVDDAEVTAGEAEYREHDAAFVTNQFTTEVDLEIDVKRTSGGSYPELRYEYDDTDSTSGTDDDGNEVSVPTGEEAVFDAVVTCKIAEVDETEASISDSNATFDVTFSVNGTGVSAEVTRQVSVDCEGTTATIPTETSTATSTPD
jgi:hypothetical protein